MRILGSIWNDDGWATRGGLVKTSWTLPPPQDVVQKPQLQRLHRVERLVVLQAENLQAVPDPEA